AVYGQAEVHRGRESVGIGPAFATGHSGGAAAAEPEARDTAAAPGAGWARELASPRTVQKMTAPMGDSSTTPTHELIQMTHVALASPRLSGSPRRSRRQTIRAID